jgi:hypothetical protein
VPWNIPDEGKASLDQRMDLSRSLEGDAAKKRELEFKGFSETQL